MTPTSDTDLPSDERAFTADARLWAFGQHPAAFKEAADIVLDKLLMDESEKRMDHLLLPVLYLYRHSIELQLKHAIRDGIDSGVLTRDKSIDDLLQSHVLDRLWTKAKESLVGYDSRAKNLASLDPIIAEFHEADPNGHTLRYDRTNKGKLNYYEHLPKRIPLKALRKKVEEVTKRLEPYHIRMGAEINAKIVARVTAERRSKR